MVDKRTRLFIKLISQSNSLKDCSGCAKSILFFIILVICVPLILIAMLFFSSLLTKYTPLHMNEYTNYTNSTEVLRCNVSITDITNKRFGCNIFGLPYVIILLIYIAIILLLFNLSREERKVALVFLIILSIIFIIAHNSSSISYYFIKNSNADCYFDQSKQIYSKQCRESFIGILFISTLCLFILIMCGVITSTSCCEEGSPLRHFYKTMKEDINTIDLEMNKMNL